MKVALIGLGAMGLPIGKRLIAAGHELTVVPHRRTAPADELANLGAYVAASIMEAAARCDTIMTSLPDVPQVDECVLGETGVITAARPGSVLVDLSTVTPAASDRIAAALKSRGIDALDAPVSGGPKRAGDGTLTIMVGGEAGVFARCLPVLEAFGTNIVHVGPAGSGQAVKLVNQLMISIIMVANAEALSLGVRAGVPLETLLRIIGTSSGSNYLLQNWLPQSLFAGDLRGGFSLALLQKDLRAALEWATELGSPTFAGSLVQQLYRLVSTPESDKLDYTVVARLYEQANSLRLVLPGKAK